MSSVLAAIDIGTNSIRLAVVRVEENHSISTLGMHREVVRLGEGEFEHNHMTPDAISRGALVCKKFAEVARGFGASEIIAFATSATREAENREEFIERVWQEAGIEVRVISGREEARLIWLGVTSGVELGDRRAVLIDIGGGSTEVIVGTSDGYRLLESLRLGAIRVSNRYFPDDGPVSPEAFARVQKQVLGVAAPVARRVKDLGFALAMGSAGTITTLADIVARRTGEGPLSGLRNYFVKQSDVREAVQALCKMPLAERLRVPGMDANRADIILGGAAVLVTLMEACGIERMLISDRGLRDGILLDHLLREESAREEFNAQSVRRRSILQLARACNYETEHAEHTGFLALRLFDELQELGAHNYGTVERELLEYAALVHDIGLFISHSNHHKHAYYLIRNSDLLGFDDTEIDLMANVALYHRKGLPKKRHENLASLGRSERQRISVLSAMLRIAEGLDRSHLGLVKEIRITRDSRPKRFRLTLFSDSDCQLEVWGVQNAAELFEYVFEAPLEVEVAPLSQIEDPQRVGSASLG